jgi:hypothetical protein
VATARECVWSAASEAGWLAITSGTTGQGDGTLAFTASSNTTPVVRRGVLVVGEARTEISQAAAPCEFRFSPAAHAADAAGGELTVAVDTVQGCTWSAASDVPWIAVIATENTGGAGTLRFRVEPNSGDVRNGGLVVAGQRIEVTQSGASMQCSFAIAPLEQSAPSAGGSRVVAISAPNGCGWAAVSGVPWIAVETGVTGNGNGTATLRIAPNTGSARSGIVTIAGQVHTVTQSGGAGDCAYEIAPSSSSAPAAGADVAVSVTARIGCAWTAASQADWIAVTDGASGNGNGTTRLTIATNAGGTRTGTVLVAGVPHSVTQAAAPVPCNFAIAPTEHTVAAAAATREVTVSAQAGCAWTAVSQAPWITVSEGAVGSGNGTVHLSIATNPGSARTGTVLIAGQTLTVAQGAAPIACAFTIAPTEHMVPPGGATREVTVSAQASCAWTAVSQAPWITVSQGAAGTGNGTVELTIARNGGGERSGTVSIAGRVHTVTQAAAPPAGCTYTLTPTTQAANLLAQDFEVQISTQPGCAWTAASTVSWITLRTAASGSGTATLGYRVGVHVGLTSRTGTIEIAGEVLTVTQSLLGAGETAR